MAFTKIGKTKGDDIVLAYDGTGKALSNNDLWTALGILFGFTGLTPEKLKEEGGERLQKIKETLRQVAAEMLQGKTIASADLRDVMKALANAHHKELGEFIIFFYPEEAKKAIQKKGLPITSLEIGVPRLSPKKELLTILAGEFAGEEAPPPETPEKPS